MTLAFGILPGVARDFSFMIQSAGMTAAAATIVMMQVQVETQAVIWSTIGGVCGIILGLEEVRWSERCSPRVVSPRDVEGWAAPADGPASGPHTSRAS